MARKYGEKYVLKVLFPVYLELGVSFVIISS